MKMLRWMTLLLASPLAAQTPALRELKVGAPAPVVVLQDLEGHDVRVGAVIGRKAAVVEFWATWCELCAALLPKMQAAKAKYAADVDFYGVNVTVNDAKARVKRYVEEHHAPYLTLYDSKGVGVRAFQAPGTSYVVIIDKAGIVRYIDSGDAQDISAALAKIVKP